MSVQAKRMLKIEFHKERSDFQIFKDLKKEWECLDHLVELPT
jgi:hypothetical protein